MRRHGNPSLPLLPGEMDHLGFIVIRPSTFDLRPTARLRSEGRGSRVEGRIVTKPFSRPLEWDAPKDGRGNAWSGSVSRILFPVRGEDHSSATRVTAVVEQPTRKLKRTRAGPCFPIWSCSAGGLPCRRRSRGTRCALTAPFHPYLPPSCDGEGRYLSVALSVASPRLDVIQPAARWSSDFPPHLAMRRSSDPLHALCVTAMGAGIIPPRPPRRPLESLSRGDRGRGEIDSIKYLCFLTLTNNVGTPTS